MEQMYLAVGRIAAGWARLEVHCSLILGDAVGTERSVSHALVTGQSIDSVWNTIEAVMECYRPDLDQAVTDFRTWRKTADELRKRRNDAVHALWAVGDLGQPAALEIFGKGKAAKRGNIRVNLFPGGIEELTGLADAIDAAWFPLQDVFMEVLEYMQQRDHRSTE